MWVITNNAIKTDPKKGTIIAGEKVNLPKEIAEPLIEKGVATLYVEPPQDESDIADSDEGSADD